MTPPELTIAMPTYENEPSLLRTVLTTALRQATQPLVVVDMSRSSVVADVCAELEGVAYTALPGSRGVSESRNECVERAGTRHVLFLDSDAVPEPGWAAAMAAGFEHDRVAIVGARVLPAWERTPSRLLRSVTAQDWVSMFDLGATDLDVPRVMGTSYALDRERLGRRPFDETLGRAPGVAVAHEEVRLAERARGDGWRCRYVAGAVVHHHVPHDRVTWSAMFKRAYVAGQETRLESDTLEPLPRGPMSRADHAFRVLMAPSFLLGRAVGPRASAG